jgi:predicted lipid carrier protein YhbT
MMKLLARLLESVSTGKIKAEASTLVALLSPVLDTRTFFFQRESAALELLDMAEASL